LLQTFKGGNLNSMDHDAKSFNAAQLKQVNHRDTSDYEHITITTGAARTITVHPATTRDKFNFGGANYKWTDNLTTGYHYGELQDLYKQHYFNVVHTLPLGDKQSLKSDLRYARSTDDGASNVDNKAFGAMFTYALGGHAF